MLTTSDKQQKTLSVNTISSNKNLLIKISTFLIMIFAFFGATPSYATSPTFMTIGVTDHASETEEEHANHSNDKEKTPLIKMKKTVQHQKR